MFNGMYWQKLSLHYAQLQKKHFDILQIYLEDILNKRDLPEKNYTYLYNIFLTLGSHSTREHIIKIFKKDHYAPVVEWNKIKYLFAAEVKIYNV